MSTTGLSQNYFLYFKKLIFSQFSDPILVFGPENIFFNNFFGQTTVFPRIRDIFGSQQNCCCDYSLEIKKWPHTAYLCSYVHKAVGLIVHLAGFWKFEQGYCGIVQLLYNQDYCQWRTRSSRPQYTQAQL